jgi:D-3-phosphoglycerate dehydrogenase
MTMKWRVMISDGLQDAGIQILNKECEVAKRKDIAVEDLLKEIPDFDALIVRSRTKVTAEIIQAADNLKVIGRCGVGVDNIDVPAAREKGITVVNAPSATSTAVAELAVGMMFSLAREIPRADASMKRGEWLKKEFMGVELYGKTLGIVGFGRIGSAVGQMAAAAGLRILACGDFTIPETIRIVGGEMVMVDEVLAEADFLTIHTPLTEKTRGMFDAQAISKMKDGVYLICTARGGVVNEHDLLDALNSGKVAGAALDVYEKEPPAFTELINHPRVIATPHIAGQTHEAQKRAAIDIAKEVLAALKGEKLHWEIT